MNKLLFIFAFVFYFINGFGQYPINQNIGSPNTLVQVPANGGFRAAIANRVFTDTSDANNNSHIESYPGAQIFTSGNGGEFWVRDATAQYWINITAGGNAGDLVPFYGCVSGCTVTWLQDYDYEVVASVYYIAGVRYESVNDTVTLDPADPTNDRIDVFVLNTSSTADKVTGTAAATPIEPDVDALTQLRISFALVEANTTEPTIGNVWIYRENDGPPTEWTTATVSGTINLASTNFPYAGTKDIEATNMPALASFTATSSTSVSWGSYDALVFKIRSKGNWTTNRPLQIYLYNSTLGLKTPPVILNTGQYGFNSSTTGVYQNVTIPLADFGNIVNMNAIQFARTSGSGTIGWYIDDIQLTTINFNPPASSGTVTSFAAGNLSPLFTTTVTNPTSTPTLSFTLSNAGAYTYFGNNTGTSAAPTYTSIRSLSASSALTDSLLVSSGGQLKLLAQSAVVPITNNVSVLNDSTILVCNYLNVCDTFEISTVTAQYVYIVNDSTLLVCASDNSTCDTLNIPQTFFDRGFFSPNQASFGATFHNAYNNDFIVVAMDTFSTDADHYLMALDGLPFSTATSLRYLAIDTLTSKLYRTSGGGITTADNGLTANTATNVRLGGTLVTNTTISSVVAANRLTITGVNTFAEGAMLDVSTSGNVGQAIRAATTNGRGVFALETSNGVAAYASSTGGGYGVFSTATSTGVAYYGSTVSGVIADLVAQPSSTNTVVNTLKITRATSGAASNGIGQSIDLYNNTTSTTELSNQIISKWSDATQATRTSQFIITGVNSAVTGDIAYFNGNGMVGIGSATASATRLNIVDNTVGAASIVNISSTSTAAASNSQIGLSIALSGANATASQTTYASNIQNIHTGTGSVNYGIYAQASGGSQNYAVYGITSTSSLTSSIYGTNSANGNGVRGDNTSGGVAVRGLGTNGYAAYFQVSGSSGSPIGLYSVADGAATTNTAARLEAINATNNYALMIPSASGRAVFGATTSNANALLELVSTNQALIIMRMTATQASAITAADGMMLYVTDTDATFTSIGFWGRENGVWVKL